MKKIIGYLLITSPLTTFLLWMLFENWQALLFSIGAVIIIFLVVCLGVKLIESDSDID